MRINPAALKAFRELVGLSQAELSRRAAVSQGRISQLEHHACEVRHPTVLALSTTLGVPDAALIGLGPDGSQ